MRLHSSVSVLTFSVFSLGLNITAPWSSCATLVIQPGVLFPWRVKVEHLSLGEVWIYAVASQAPDLLDLLTR
jgi:hypothetical protein